MISHLKQTYDRYSTEIVNIDTPVTKKKSE